MIHLEYYNEKIISSSFFEEPVILAIQKTARNHPDETIMISKKGVDTSIFKNQINEVVNPYTIISTATMSLSDLGYVEDSPFINVSTNHKYPTWIKSDELVCIHAALVNQLSRHLSSNTSFFYWINSVAKLSRPLGILNYQLPSAQSRNELSNVLLYRFVKQHYKSRWTFLLLLCHVWYDKRFPLYAFAKAQFYKNRSLKLDVEELQQLEIISVQQAFNYDVVIPTMGRATYLKDVLSDLGSQEIQPQTVVIVEQNEDENSVSELNYLREEQWPFKIIHEFTHVTGACRARNEAINHSSAPWVLLFDDDVRVQASFSTQVEEFLNRSKAKCVTFACLQKGETETMQAFKQWESFGSGCSIVHRDVLEKCSFDMALEHGYGEDVDYGMQVRNAGFDVIYAPQIQILHLKAPVGGFRKPYVFPWNDDEIQPKPSPQIMYHRKKNYTYKQLLGYKMVQLFKTFGVFGTKLPWNHYKKYQQAWNQSEKWANKL
ncbi:glycosyltransferase family 2 protein [Nonlabens ulvanivorans]|uniref:glycosyltransferase family 2 protein n=1 Tax=Nonlabens ulvanivorans TaxID=906888 RepID=UPI0037CACB62